MFSSSDKGYLASSAIQVPDQQVAVVPPVTPGIVTPAVPLTMLSAGYLQPWTHFQRVSGRYHDGCAESTRSEGFCWEQHSNSFGTRQHDNHVQQGRGNYTNLILLSICVHGCLHGLHRSHCDFCTSEHPGPGRPSLSRMSKVRPICWMVPSGAA